MISAPPAAERRGRVGLLLLAAAVGLACDTAPDAPVERAETAPMSIEMPPPGQLRLRVLDEGLTLLANGAPRGPLLEVLAMQLGFELQASDLGDEPVTIQLELGRLEDALPTLLPDRAYRVDYHYDAETKRHRLARLEVAARGAQTLAQDGASTPPEASEPPASVDPPTADDPEPEGKTDWKALVALLDDSDPDERISALEQIDPDGEGLPLIVDRLARDPDPRVRVVAAEKLEFADTLAGVDALVGALSDSHRDVVLAAIEALELTDDYTVTQDLAVLLEHPDVDIRNAAREAIEFIEPDEDDE